MARIADIIPISSRRQTPTAAPPPEAAERSLNGGWILLVAILGVLVVGLLFTLTQERVQRTVAHLATPNRTAIFRRAYDELRDICRLPEADDGPVQERCRSTASFVLLFPECDRACGETARALLPHARR